MPRKSSASATSATSSGTQPMLPYLRHGPPKAPGTIEPVLGPRGSRAAHAPASGSSSAASSTSRSKHGHGGRQRGTSAERRRSSRDVSPRARRMRTGGTEDKVAHSSQRHTSAASSTTGSRRSGRGPPAPHPAAAGAGARRGVRAGAGAAAAASAPAPESHGAEGSPPQKPKRAPAPKLDNLLQLEAASTRYKKREPLIQFTPVSMRDYRTVRSQRAAIARGERPERPSEPALGGSSRKPGSHVSNCTCPQCRKALRKSASVKGPPTLLYKMHSSGIVLVHATLRCHGFKLTAKDNWNVLWTSAHLKSYVFQGLRKHQKVNQFPRSYEVTRKDALARNVTKMMQLFGERHFGFLPRSFVLPVESEQFLDACREDPSKAWIVKPSTSSRGRGIYITQRHQAISGSQRSLEDDNCTVSHYVDRPLLYNGVKFDLRIYVAVTSFYPLRVYVHEEGLARFATEKYDPDPKHYKNQFMHLTNYSINKTSSKFVSNVDETADDVGHKWSLTALKRHLRAAGYNVDMIWSQIYDLVIKTLISIEAQVTAAQRMFVPGANCFELFGFDVLIDEDLHPWLLEVNFSPSLNCDAPLDHNIKAGVLSELFTLAGIPLHDPRRAALEQRRREQAMFSNLSPRKAAAKQRRAKAAGRSKESSGHRGGDRTSMYGIPIAPYPAPNAEEDRLDSTPRSTRSGVSSTTASVTETHSAMPSGGAAGGGAGGGAGASADGTATATVAQPAARQPPPPQAAVGSAEGNDGDEDVALVSSDSEGYSDDEFDKDDGAAAEAAASSLPADARDGLTVSILDSTLVPDDDAPLSEWPDSDDGTMRLTLSRTLSASALKSTNGSGIALVNASGGGGVGDGSGGVARSGPGGVPRQRSHRSRSRRGLDKAGGRVEASGSGGSGSGSGGGRSHSNPPPNRQARAVASKPSDTLGSSSSFHSTTAGHHAPASDTSGASHGAGSTHKRLHLARRAASASAAASAHFMSELSPDERRAVREASDEYGRRGRFVRVFPSQRSYMYKPFFAEPRPLNDVLADHLFHVAARAKQDTARSAETTGSHSNDATITMRERIHRQQAKSSRKLRRDASARSTSSSTSSKRKGGSEGHHHSRRQRGHAHGSKGVHAVDLKAKAKSVAALYGGSGSL